MFYLEMSLKDMFLAISLAIVNCSSHVSFTMDNSSTAHVMLVI